jgi:glyoxylase-like metal-dependent hydrolase (beta-lactamase superfamily II)/8-oxo-dGTP pyrophosphatase MutT (NUDIX family)
VSATDRRRIPRASAVVLLVRGPSEALETFWVRRSDLVSYMPGFRSFVGGTVNPEDAELEIEGAPEGPERVILACAFREAFEETGVLLGVADPGPFERLAEPRRRLLAGEATFPALAHEHGWRFRADALAFAGRWVSPPFAPRGFETDYFLARVPEGQEASVHVGELAEGEWVRPREAIERWRLGTETFAAPILWSLIAMAEGESGLAERLIEAPKRSGSPIRRIELKWGIVLHPMKTRPLPPATHTNAYLVGESEMALVDPGSDDPAEIASLLELIEVLRADGRRVRLILLTHHHPDHVAGVSVMRERLGVPVAAHAETARHVKVELVLKDGDWIPLLPGAGDWNLRAIHTPGHARGHLCFLHERTRSLLTGDHIPGGQGTVIIDPPEGDMAAYVASLERLLGEPVDTIFPGHGAPQGAAPRRIRWLIAHRLEREAKVVGALDGEPRTLAQLVESAYADTPRDLWGYAERSLLAHLIKLEGEGRAERVGESWRARSR